MSEDKEKDAVTVGFEFPGPQRFKSIIYVRKLIPPGETTVGYAKTLYDEVYETFNKKHNEKVEKDYGAKMTHPHGNSAPQQKKQNTETKPCPDCQGQLSKRNNKDGRTFWGCSNYKNGCRHTEDCQ